MWTATTTASSTAASDSFETGRKTKAAGGVLTAKQAPHRPGTLTFNPGETSKPITIAVKGDNKREGMMPASRI
jgi:hypothetical protein